MKRLFVFVPAMALALFLFNSFVLKEKKTTKKTEVKATKAGVANIVLRSTDGGQTWQDISKGLPEKMQKTGVWSNGVFADDNGLHILDGKGIYHNEPNSKTDFWQKETFPGIQREITAGRNGIFAHNTMGQFLHQVNGKANWSPIYTDFQEQAKRIDKSVDNYFKQEKQVRTFFETAGGTVFIASNNFLFRSANSGKTWKQTHAGDGRMKLAESNGVLLSTSYDGILRSTDDGQTWDRVISEGGAGIAVEPIDSGFAAIVYNPVVETNTVYISQDNGKTWNQIAQKLQPSRISLLFEKIGGNESSLNIMSIKQAGKYLICGRPDGIYRSADMGKTWKLLLPLAGKMGFNLYVSGDVIYAMPGKGC